MEFRNLETFVWVARLSSFRLAAERLRATQPAISARIALLEEEFGARLLNRGPRRIELTPAGAELMRHAENLLALRSEMMVAVGQAASLRGRLRLGVPETIVHTWLAELVERIAAEHPAVTLDIDVDSTPALQAGLAGSRLDVAFVYAQGPDERLVTERLCEFPLGWFASPALDLPAGEVTLAECCRRPIVTHRRGSAPFVAVQHVLAQAGLGRARIFGSSAIAAIVRLALDGLGVCVVPEAVVRREVQSGALRRLDVRESLPPLDFYVSTRRDADSPLPGMVAKMAIEVAGAAERSVERADC